MPRYISTTVAAALASLSLYLTETRAQDSPGCLQLESSSACRAFSGYYIGISQLAQTYSFLANVTDVQSFDASMYNHVQSSSPDYLTKFGCPSNNDTQTKLPYARYSLTRLCAFLVQDATSSLPCNAANNIAPEPLCQSTCLEWAYSASNITSGNSDLCPNQNSLNHYLSTLLNQCQSWAGLSGTGSTCILGSDNEPDNCGFQDDTDSACAYCNLNSSDACCQSLKSNSLSGGAVAGIVIGSLTGAALIAFLFYIFYRRRKNDQKLRFLPVPYSRTSADNASYKHPPLIVRTHDGRHNKSSETKESLIGNNYHGDAAASPQQSPLVDSFNDDVRQSLVGPNFEGRGAEEKIQLPTTSQQQQAEPPEPPMHMVEMFCEAIHSYTPQVDDELALERGDIVYLIFQLDDGWGYGHNLLTSKTGVFPLIFVMEARQELLEQYFLPPNTDNNQQEYQQPQEFQEKTLVEDPAMSYDAVASRQQAPTSAAASERSNASSQRILQECMQRVRDDVRRSISLTSMRRISRIQRSSPPVWVQHHSTVPKRAASILHSPDNDPSISTQHNISPTIHDNNAESYEMRRAE